MAVDEAFRAQGIGKEFKILEKYIKEKTNAKENNFECSK